MTAQPQDHKPKANQMVRDAISLQAANLLQKAQLDFMATKIILVLKEAKVAETVGGSALTVDAGAEQLEMHLAEIRRLLSMTRDEASAARASFQYPDERIQAVLNEATDKIAAILLDDVA